MRRARRGATRSAAQHSAAQHVQAAHARLRRSARTCTCAVRVGVLFCLAPHTTSLCVRHVGVPVLCRFFPCFLVTCPGVVLQFRQLPCVVTGAFLWSVGSGVLLSGTEETEVHVGLLLDGLRFGLSREEVTASSDVLDALSCRPQDFGPSDCSISCTTCMTIAVLFAVPAVVVWILRFFFTFGKGEILVPELQVQALSVPMLTRGPQ